MTCSVATWCNWSLSTIQPRQIGEASMIAAAGGAVVDQQPAVVAALGRALRDALRGELVVVGVDELVQHVGAKERRGTQAIRVCPGPVRVARYSPGIRHESTIPATPVPEVDEG